MKNTIVQDSCWDCQHFSPQSDWVNQTCKMKRPQHAYWGPGERLKIRPIAPVCLDPEFSQLIDSLRVFPPAPVSSKTSNAGEGV